MRRIAKRTVILALTAFLISVSTQAQQKKRPSCWETAASQSAMNECATLQLRVSQQRMDSMLRKLGIDSQNPAQKAWEAYRDTQLEAIYPAASRASEGSVMPMCWTILESSLIDDRVRDLKHLTTNGEGDVCSGLKPAARNQRKSKTIPVKHCPAAAAAAPAIANSRAFISATD